MLEASTAERKARVGARRSIFANGDLLKGNPLRPHNITFLRPGGGLEPWEADDILSRPLNQDVPTGTALNAAMFG